MVSELTLMLQPRSIVCHEYTTGTVARVVGVIISPIRIMKLADGSYSIAWGCSLGISCKNEQCRYARKAEEEAT